MILTAQYDTIGNGRTLDFLAIFGHGAEGFQGLGCGKEYDTDGDRSLYYQGMAARGHSHLAGDCAQKLRALNGVLSNKGEILLGGCSVGKGRTGSGLLTTISSLLKNRAVHAFENDVYWWTGGLSGSLKTARGSVVKSQKSSLRLGDDQLW